MKWAFILGVGGLAISFVVAFWDDFQKLWKPDSGHSRWPVVIKIVLALLALGVAVYSFFETEELTKSLTTKLDTANVSITNITKQLEASDARLFEALKSASEKDTKLASVTAELTGAKLNAAKEKETRLFQEFSTGKFDLSQARDALSNRFDRMRLEEDKKRLDDAVAAPTIKAAEEKARQEQQEAALKRKEANLSRFVPFVEDTLTSLLRMLRDALEGTVVTNVNWNCQDVRELVANNGRCQIKVGDNSLWTYDIAVNMFNESIGQRTQLQIVCMSSTNNRVSYRNTMEVMWLPSFNHVRITFSALGGQMQYSDNVDIPKSTNAVRASLSDLIAAHPDVR